MIEGPEGRERRDRLDTPGRLAGHGHERAGATFPVRVYQCVLLAASLLCGGCGASGRSAAPAAMAPAEESGAHAEIARLWDEIDGWRGQAGLAGGEAADAEQGSAALESTPTAGYSGQTSAAPQAPEAPEAACPAAAAEPLVCRDACTLATSICDNAGRICRIAQQLAGDDWAAGKCADANAVCRQATADCCDCRASR
jgi:hypothetical protein